MILNKLELHNFRNYESLLIELNPKINFFIGKNGMGKTNIIEAIYMLAITKSYRTNLDKKVIKLETKKTNVRVKMNNSNSIYKILELELDDKNKKFLIDKTEIKKLSDYISNLNVILFSPELIELIKGSPQTKRKFLNIEISQINKKYLKVLNIYNKVLKTRNEYLKYIKDKKYIDEIYFDILTNKLIENAVYIYKERNEFILNINKLMDKIYKEIAHAGELRIKYLVSFDNFNEEEIRNYLKIKYKNNLTSEIEQGTTLIGPHRDDFIFVLEGKDIKNYGSQGQQKMCLLSLKLAEIELFKEKTGEMPIVLLDDIFGELDINKKTNILSFLTGDYQMLITTTEINKKKIKNASIFTVINGNIVKIEKVE